MKSGPFLDELDIGYNMSEHVHILDERVKEGAQRRHTEAEILYSLHMSPELCSLYEKEKKKKRKKK